MILNRARAYTENYKLVLEEKRVYIYWREGIFPLGDSRVSFPLATLEIINGDTCGFQDLITNGPWQWHEHNRSYDLSELRDISRLVLLLPHIKDSNLSIIEFQVGYYNVGFKRRLDGAIEKLY